METRLTSAASSAPGDIAFTSPASALLNTNDFASAALVLATDPNSELLVVTGPARKPPPTAKITGVTMYAEHQRSGIGTIVNLTAQLVHGGSGIGTNQSAGAAVGSSKGIAKWGGRQNTMGATITPAMARASTFGAQYAASCTANNATIRVFRLWLNIHSRPERHARQREYSRTRGS